MENIKKEERIEEVLSEFGDVPRAFIAGAMWCRRKMWVEMEEVEDACLADGDLCVVAVYMKGSDEYLGMCIAQWDAEKGMFALADADVEVRRFIVIPDYEGFCKKDEKNL